MLTNPNFLHSYAFRKILCYRQKWFSRFPMPTNLGPHLPACIGQIQGPGNWILPTPTEVYAKYITFKHRIRLSNTYLSKMYRDTLAIQILKSTIFTEKNLD